MEESIAELCGLFFLNLEEQDEKELEVRIQAVLRWLESHPGYLLVIDNVDTEQTRDAVLELLPRLRQGHVLVTSRLHSWPAEVNRLQLDVLSEADGVALLLGYRASPKMPAETDSADALVLARDLDGLALALEQAAAYLNTVACTVAEYHELWKKNGQRVHEWHDPAQKDYSASVATTWLTSFNELEPQEQTLLRLLSWLAPDPVPRTLLRPLEEKKLAPDPLEGRSPQRALGGLLNFSLVKPASGGRAFAVHRLVQQITRERQCPEPTSGLGSAQFGSKVARPVPMRDSAPCELVRAVWWVGEDFAGHSDDVRSWSVLVPLLPHALAVSNFAAERKIREPRVAQLFSVAALLLHTQGNHRAAKRLYRRALTIPAG